MNIRDLEYYYRNSRRSGSTTWILRSALKNPRCIIVFGSFDIALKAEKDYHRMKRNACWILKIKWFFKKPINPVFTSIKTVPEGFDRPIIFDNSSLKYI